MTKKNLPWFEDIFVRFFYNTMLSLFPKNIESKRDKIIVYIVGYFHLLGALVLIHAPIFLPPNLLPYYIVYVIMNFVAYALFEQQCFMSLLTNYYAKAYMNPLNVRFRLAVMCVVMNLIIAIIGVIYPSLAPYNIIKYTLQMIWK